MTDPVQQIKNIQDKLQQLLKQQALLQKENQRLKKELEKAGTLTEEKEQAMHSLQQQVDVLKMGSGNLSETEKNALGKRIDGYLKEIDKCLALLNT
jgi:regulator of replication initiation timing